MAEILLGADLSEWRLDFDRDPFRLPPRHVSLRGADYEDRFDFTTLFADMFWRSDGKAVILTGPTPYASLDDLDLHVYALPSGSECKLDHHHKVMMTDTVVEVPEGTKALRFESAIGTRICSIQPNLGDFFADRRVLLTLSRDNELTWIRDWAHYHVEVHGCDAVLLYDNASNLYDSRDVAETLSRIPGLARVAVIDWPFPYGVFDVRQPLSLGLIESLSCQPMALEHARQRCLGSAKSVLSLDVDELVLKGSGGTAFEVAENSRTGYVRFDGVWIENVRDKLGEPAPAELSGDVPEVEPDPIRHQDFSMRRSGGGEACEPKWAVAPGGLADPVQWHIHSILGGMATTESSGTSVRHFRAINTDWDIDNPRNRVARTEGGVQSPDSTERDEALSTLLASIDWDPSIETSGPIKEDTARSVYRLRREAASLFDQGRREEALAAISRAIQAAPDHPGLEEFRAELLERQGDPGAAGAGRQSAASKRERSGWFHYQKGQWAEFAGEFHVAHEHWRDALELSPKANEARIRLAASLTEFGEFQEALSLAENAVMRAPKDPEALLVLAKALSSLGKPYEALNVLQKAVSIDPHGFVAHLRLGEHLLSMGAPDKADAMARRALKLANLKYGVERSGRAFSRGKHEVTSLRRHPVFECDGSTALRLLARSLFRLGRLEEAEDMMKFAIEVTLRPSALLLELSNIVEVRGRKAVAEEIRNRAHTLAIADLGRFAHPNLSALARMREKRGFLLVAVRSSIATGDIENAKKLCETAISEFPDEPQFVQEYASTLDQSGNKPAAIAALRAGYKRFPARCALIFQLARLLVASSEEVEAEALLREAISLEPWHSGTKRLWHRVLSMLDRSDEAFNAAQSDVVAFPTDPSFQAELGRLYAERGEWSDAADAYRAACDAAPWDPNYRRRLSLMLDRLGDRERATIEARTAVERTPENAPALHHLACLLTRGKVLDDAEALERRAIQIFDAEPAYYKQLCEILKRQGRIEVAADVARQAISSAANTSKWKSELHPYLPKKEPESAAGTDAR